MISEKPAKSNIEGRKAKQKRREERGGRGGERIRLRAAAHQLLVVREGERDRARLLCLPSRIRISIERERWIDMYYLVFLIVRLCARSRGLRRACSLSSYERVEKKQQKKKGQRVDKL